MAKITAWLGQQGFSVDRVARGGMWIEFSGAAGQVNAAFRTQLRRYQVGGEQHLANAAPISIPSAMVSLVKGLPLHDFFRTYGSCHNPRYAVGVQFRRLIHR